MGFRDGFRAFASDPPRFLMYHLYHTLGFVLGSVPAGEADRRYRIFTRDLGLVRATATGVRLSASKLRPGLSDFSFSHFVLVRGRNSWRIVSILPRSNLFTDLSVRTGIFEIFARVFLLLQRLIQGEEKNEILFTHLASAFAFARYRAIPPPLARSFEHALVLRVLHSLGYVGSAPSVSSLIGSLSWSEETLHTARSVETEALTEINRSLKATQL